MNLITHLGVAALGFAAGHAAAERGDGNESTTEPPSPILPFILPFTATTRDDPDVAPEIGVQTVQLALRGMGGGDLRVFTKRGKTREYVVLHHHERGLYAKSTRELTDDEYDQFMLWYFDTINRASPVQAGVEIAGHEPYLLVPVAQADSADGFCSEIVDPLIFALPGDWADREGIGYFTATRTSI